MASRRPIFDDAVSVDPSEALTAAWREEGRQEIARELGFREWTAMVPEPHGPLDLHRFRFQQALYGERALSDRELVVKKASQLGISSWAIRWALYWADMRGKTILYVVPTEKFLTDYSMHRVREVLRKSEWLQSRMGRDAVNNRAQRQVGLGWLYMRGAAEATNLESIPADGLMLDEYDSLLPPAHIGVAEQRVTGPLSEGLIRRVGVPSLPGVGIARMYEKTTQNVWMVKCGACGEHQEIVGSKTYGENVDEAAGMLVCRKCRRALDVAGGEWVATYPDRDVLGYWMTKFILPSVDLRKIIENHHKSAIADRQTHYNRDLGEEWAPAEGRLSRDAILACTRPGELHMDEGGLRTFKGVTMGCCLPGTPITQSDGTTLPIEELREGDRVRTRRGDVARVTRRMCRHYDGSVYSIGIYGQAERLELTEEHPIWTDRGWVKAEAIRVGDRVLTPRIVDKTALAPALPLGRRRRMHSPERNAAMAAARAEGVTWRAMAEQYGISIAAAHSAVQRHRQREHDESHPTSLDIEALATVLGYYLAEGSLQRDLRRKHGQPTAISWDFHPDETELMADLANAIGRLGYRLGRPYIRWRLPSGRAKNGGQSCNVICGSPRLAELLVRLGGRGAAEKRLAEEVLGWPQVAQRRMLMAYLDGDGCWRRPKPHLWRVEAGTASCGLAQQLHAIALRCGIRMTPPRRQHSPSAVRVGARPKWVLQASFASHELRDGVFRTPRENARSEIRPDGLWRRVTVVERRQYAGDVLNLDVDGDDTYLAAYVAVHNCDVASARALNVRVSEHLDDYRKRLVWVGTVEARHEGNEERAAEALVRALSDLMVRFDVNMAAIDHLPERTIASTFAARHRGRVYLVAYKTDPRPKTLWNVDDAEQFVSIHRTAAIDATLQAFREQRNLLPDLAELPAEYPDHLGALIRVQERDETDRVRVYYRSVGPDDFAQAEIYDLVATELMHRARGMGAIVEAQANPTPLREPDSIPERLDDDYDPALGLSDEGAYEPSRGEWE